MTLDLAALRLVAGLLVALVVATGAAFVPVRSPLRSLVLGTGLWAGFVLAYGTAFGIPVRVDASIWMMGYAPVVLVCGIFSRRVHSRIRRISLAVPILVIGWILQAQAKFEYAWSGPVAIGVVVLLVLLAGLSALNGEGSGLGLAWPVICGLSALVLSMTGSLVLGLQAGFLCAAWIGMSATRRFHQSDLLPMIGPYLYASVVLQGMWYSDLPGFVGAILLILPFLRLPEREAQVG